MKLALRGVDGEVDPTCWMSPVESCHEIFSGMEDQVTSPHNLLFAGFLGLQEILTWRFRNAYQPTVCGTVLLTLS